ncbi:MAG: 30S ribosomal protein S13 [Candidatus Hermodarchaeota archaeon]|nr:30S ribosomal protein S13 [Candidatus Hermodarchaeota archaeon]
MSSSYRHIIRIARTDIDGSQKLDRALSAVKGVGRRLARAIVKVAKLNPDQRAGYITDAEVAKIEEVLQDPSKHGIPQWMLNRQKDMTSGNNKHLIGADLDFQLKMDIDYLMKTKNWRGVRHGLGLKVRGQRTRTTGRRGRTVGVSRKRRA